MKIHNITVKITRFLMKYYGIVTRRCTDINKNSFPLNQLYMRKRPDRDE